MDEPKSKSATEGGSQEPPNTGTSALTSEFKKPEAQEAHEGKTAKQPTGHEQRAARWTDVAVARSSIIQAIFGALIFFATAINVWTTYEIKMTTDKYASYTQDQATAESLSAKAAKSEATAAATEAADETIAARAATAALAGQQSEATTENTHFTQQLARLDAGNQAQIKVARAAERSARISKIALVANGREFRIDERPYVSAEATSEAWNGNTLTVTMVVKNWGKTPAYQVRLRGIIKPYTFNAPPIRLREWDTFHLMSEPQYRSWGDFPGIEAGDFKVFKGGPTFFPYEAHYAQTNPWTWVTAGYVTYEDGLGNTYTSDYCMHRGAGGNPPEFCQGHNDPDVRPTPGPRRSPPHPGKRPGE